MFYKFNYKVFSYFVIFLIFFPILTFGQFLTKDSSNFNNYIYSDNLFNTNFLKQLNTYSLNTNLVYSFKKGALFTGIYDKYNSSIYKSSVNNIKDENYFSLLLDYRLSRLFSSGILIKNSIYSDNRQVNINQASYTNALLFVKFFPINNVSFTSYSGYSNNNQLTEKDYGFLYGLESKISKLTLNDFVIYFNGKYEDEFIDPRKNNYRLANIELINDISEGLQNSFSAFYSSQSKDFYLEADSITQNLFNITNNIQTRKEQYYYLQEKMSFLNYNSPFNFYFGSKVLWRNIDKTTKYIRLQDFSTDLDSEIKDFKLDLFSEFIYTFNNFNINFKASYSEQEEKHFAKKIIGISDLYFEEKNEAEKLLNNKSKQTTLSLSMLYELSSKDILAFSLFHRKLVYDTPSKDNFDDRDELLSMLRINYLRKLTPFFSAFINLEFNFNKIVYIFSQKSANNNVKRIIKLASGGTYKIKNFISVNSAEVIANYVVYDFEDLNPNYKSFSFRQFIFRDSTSLFLDKNIELNNIGHLKLSEQGEFNWKNFSGLPIRFLSEIYTEPIIYYKFNNIKMGVGLRYFELNTYNIKNGKTKLLDTKYSSLAPLSKVYIKASNKLLLEINGRYEFIKNEKKKLSNQTYFYLDLNWKL